MKAGCGEPALPSCRRQNAAESQPYLHAGGRMLRRTNYFALADWRREVENLTALP
jgi:hypothetical protein